MSTQKLVSIVTGGASGIGAATVQEFLQHGWITVIADRNQALGTKIVETAKQRGQEASFELLDIASEESVNHLVEAVHAKYGRIDASVHCAGIGGPTALLHELPLKVYQRVVDVDMTGTFLYNKALIAYWHKQEPRLLKTYDQLGSIYQRGALVDIASVNGTAASPYMGDYGAAKHGVNGLVKSFAAENATSGIRVNAVSPGVTFTPIMQVDNFKMEEVEIYLEQQAMRRFAHPAEIAGACYFLCSDEASFVTGSNLHIDGAWTAH